MDNKLQWALYALMVSEQEELPVALSEYFFTSLKSGGLVSKMPPPPKESVIQLVARLSERHEKGAFPQAASSSGCKYCDYKDICGKLPARRSQLETKFSAEDDKVNGLYSDWKYASKWVNS